MEITMSAGVCPQAGAVEVECTNCRVIWEEDIVGQSDGICTTGDDILCPICKSTDYLVNGYVKDRGGVVVC